LSEVLAKFAVAPIYITEGSTPIGKWMLRRFQEEVLDCISSKRDILLTAPTGSGKTLSLFLGEQGAVGLYPNNTLLLDQQKSIDKILREALKARLVENEKSGNTDILRIYALGEKLPYSSASKVAVVLLSGKYIGYERDSGGRVIPKRVTLIKKIIDKTCYPERTGATPYTIVLGTPDTAMMIMAGIYRNFEKVGYALHDAFLASVLGQSIEHVLSKHKVALVEEMSQISSIRNCLLKYPWFIDEFHLYGLYETTMVLPLLHVYRDYIGWDEPIIFSSATPRGVLYENINKIINKVHHIDADIRTAGAPETLVRGRTDVEVVAVDVPGRGVSKWFMTGYYVDTIISDKINEIKQVVNNGDYVFVVVDRVNQVDSIVSVLRNHGLQPECSVTIKPIGCVDSGLIVVGSESISQGIDRPNVKYGIITSYNWATLLQRFGRIGRKTDSKVILVLPRSRGKYSIEDLNGKTISYDDFIRKVKDTYTDLDLSKKPKVEKIEKVYNIRSKLIEYMGVIAYSKVSTPGGVFGELSRQLKEDINILNSFYGSSETLASILRFRSSGPQVIVEKSNGEREKEEVDLGTVLRNYTLEKVYKDIDKVNGMEREILVVRINLEPNRYKLVLSPGPSTRDDLPRYLDGMVTTLGTILDLGYRLEIKPWEGSGNTIVIYDVPYDVRDQAVAVLYLSQEIVDYYVYTGSGAEIRTGEKSALALFL